MGLGLAVSRDIVEAHGGRMGFDTIVGQGSTFWFELPVQDEA
jgi:chemotaxis family two-component system sensor kinase Cph1